MRNRYLKLIAFICLSFFFSSCEEVIELDLDYEKKLVIEANITDLIQEQVIYVSTTSEFYKENGRLGVSGAVVTVKDENTGFTFTFNESSTVGKYVSRAFKGTEGHSYKLSVEFDGKSYSSVSEMPKKVKLDSVSMTEITFFDEAKNYVKVHYKDPEDIINSYRYILKINNKELKEFFVDNDKFNNGNAVENTIYSDEPDIVVGDEIELEFQCIDPLVYRYFFAIRQIMGEGGPPVAAANPKSNIDNDALGYFSVHTVERVSFSVVK